MGVPVGYSGQSALAMVRLRSDEPTYPSDPNVLTLLNAGLEQVAAALDPVRLEASYPTASGQNTVTLGSDVQDIVSASWSNGSPNAPGTNVYPLTIIEQQSFMDIAGGFPQAGTGPPQWAMITQDFGSGPLGPLPAPAGSPALSAVAGTSPGYTAYVAFTYVNADGETTPSQTSPQQVDTAHQVQAGSPVALGNANGYNVYATTVENGTLYKQNASPVAIGTPFTLPGTLLTATAAPTANTATGYPSGGQITIQLYPPAMVGQVNLYYRARPLLWADTTSVSYTNMDSMAQEAAILWTVARVLEARGRSDEAAQIFQPQYEKKIQELQGIIRRRTTPRSGQVRNVRDRSYPNGYFGWPGF